LVYRLDGRLLQRGVSRTPIRPAAIFAGEFPCPLVVLAITEGAKVELATALLVPATMLLSIALACLAAGLKSRRILAT
jgi:hypothetical protein